MINMHYCSTSDGVSIGCICSTGRDHDEYEMDLDPNAPTEEPAPLSGSQESDGGAK